MISQRNSRLTHLVFMVLLVAPAFMVSTPAQGMFSRAAVRGAGMRRALPNRIQYGFSLVDLIADNPWKSGLAAAGVIALITYFYARKKVNKTVITGFRYVGDGFSSFGHQVKFQYKKRVKKYSETELTALNKAYEAAETELKELQVAQANAQAAFNLADENRYYFVNHRTYIKEGEMPLRHIEAGLLGAVNDATHMNTPKIASLIVDYAMPKDELQAEEHRLRKKWSEEELLEEECRLNKEWVVAADTLSTARKAYKDKAADRDEYDALRASIAKRRGCRVEDLQQCNEKIREVAAELTKIKERMDDQMKKEGQSVDPTDSERYKELLEEKAKFEKELRKKQAERDQLLGSQKQKSQAPQAPEAASAPKSSGESQPSNVPLPPCSTSSSRGNTASSSSSASGATLFVTSSANDSNTADSVFSASSGTASCSSSSNHS